MDLVCCLTASSNFSTRVSSCLICSRASSSSNNPACAGMAKHRLNNKSARCFSMVATLVLYIAPAILRPGSLVMASRFGLFFAIADGFDLAGFRAAQHEHLLHAICTTLAESQVVLIATAFIGIAFHANIAIRVLPQIFCMRYHCLLYTSDAADDLLCVDLGGRRIIKK